VTRVPSLEAVESFARSRIFTSLGKRYETGWFDRTLWMEMADLGLLGLSVAEEYGGGGGPDDLAAALRVFARSGCDLGLTLSWITHLSLLTKSIELFGTDDQKNYYLSKLVSGELVGAAAFSEPMVGAHPGKMTTTAREEYGGYVLDGKKLFTTDGPVADVIMVLAVTGESSGGKELTLFLLDLPADGCTVSTMPLDFLMTSPHGEFEFEGVMLAPDNVLGGPGMGHSPIGKAAFARERACVLCALCGFYDSLAQETADRYRQKYEDMDLEGKTAGSWIHHVSALEVYRRISAELVSASFEGGAAWEGSMDLLIYLGLSYAKWGYWIGQFIVENGIEPGFPMDIMLSDMKVALVNESLLIKEGRKRYLH
jgi:alkylation response protein AidB-like acyl-CoA dehydrogenase